MLIDEVPGVEEQYSSAVSSSNLRVDLDRRNEADAIIAAGWNPARIGAALMRLHTEYDKVAKPKPMAPEAIRRMAASITVLQIAPLAKELEIDVGTLRPSAAVEAIAKAHAHAWYMREMRQMLGKLTGFSMLRDVIAKEVKTWGLDAEAAQEVVIEVIRWWLSPRCTTCHGTKWQLIPGSNRQSNHVCRACRGSGEAPIPFEATGKRLLGWMNECRGSARGNIRDALRNSMGRD